MILALLVGGGRTLGQGESPRTHATSLEYNRALGVGCVHCHDTMQFAVRSKPTFDFARRMEQMVRALNDGPLQGIGAISCWSCHRGRATPARLPRAAWESLAQDHAAAFEGGREELALAMSVYAASLGVDCTYCHQPGNWKNTSKATHARVRTMLTIFDVIPPLFDPAVRMPRTQCFMCHQGHVQVEREAARSKPQ